MKRMHGMLDDDSGFLQLSGLTKRFDEVTAVDRISLIVQRGELLTLLGPSGCGKTTTLRMVAGFERPSAGRILFEDRDVTSLAANRRNVGFVFQNYALFPHLSAEENVAFGLRERKLPRAAIKQRVARYLELVRLGGLGHRRPRQLSGGQQQRVALARALAIEPTILLLDEPLGALDRKMREEMQIELRQLLKGLESTAVFVTHDQDEALALSDRIAVMNEGRIEQVAPPKEIYDRPATAFCAGFLGLSNLFRGHLAAGSLHLRSGLTLPCAIAAGGGEVSVMARPEFVELARAEGQGAVRGRVEAVKYLGATTQYRVGLSRGELLVASVGAHHRLEFAEGDEVWARVPEHAWRLLEGESATAEEAPTPKPRAAATAP
jgi:ABC-type Fe3+/spermidine/putrescine transport system ATPase subunit